MMQTSDFEIMVQLPYTEECAGIKVMSRTRTRYPADVCAEMMKRAIFLTSTNWQLARGDIQTNCQFNQCTQIRGAADSLFLAVDKGLQAIPVP